MDIDAEAKKLCVELMDNSLNICSPADLKNGITYANYFEQQNLPHIKQFAQRVEKDARQDERNVILGIAKKLKKDSEHFYYETCDELIKRIEELNNEQS